MTQNGMKQKQDNNNNNKTTKVGIITASSTDFLAFNPTPTHTHMYLFSYYKIRESKQDVTI